MSEQTVRPNHYRVRVRVRDVLGNGTARAEVRASTEVELECQDLIEALDLNFNEGNILKYLFRAGKKTLSKDEDLKKVFTYAGFAVADHERKVAPVEKGTPVTVHRDGSITPRMPKAGE